MDTVNYLLCLFFFLTVSFCLFLFPRQRLSSTTAVHKVFRMTEALLSHWLLARLLQISDSGLALSWLASLVVGES